jgi:hypothetical protein
MFFSNKERMQELMASGTPIIFHCEFSQKRGPAQYRTLRELDRYLHIDVYPKLIYSEIYILEGGYS